MLSHKPNNLLSKFIDNGIRSDLGFDQISRIRISNVISIVGSLFAFGYSMVLFAHGQYRMAINDLVFIANLLLLYLLNYLQLYRIGSILIFITIPVTLLLVNYEYGDIGTEYYYYAMIVLSFYYFKRPQNRFLTSSYLVILILISKYLETVVVLTDFTLKVESYIMLSNVFMSLAILFLSLSLFIKEHQKHQIEIEEKNSQLNDALADAQQKNEQVNLVLKELNHRVKNNLQMVSSLFNIQAYKTRNSETKRALRDAQNRIVSIAIMHQKLYKDNLFHEVILKNYVLDLVDYLNQSVGENEHIVITTNIEDLALRIEDTVHVGLIINELVTNALKYGASKGSGEVNARVLIESQNSELKIAVSDKGKGFGKNFSIEKSDSFGLDLVKSIVQQHEGSIKTFSSNGANVEVILKIKEN